MIRQIHLLRNIGNFHSVNVAATIALTRLVLIYAENGRGKTTLAAVLRSLSTGDPIPITERRTLASTHPPHVVLDCEGDPSSTIFQNGAWNRTFPRLVVFDDVFVDANIHSGLAVDARHRQNLHEVVLGAQGVALSRRIQQLVSDIEDHNRTLRVKRDDITRVLPQGLSVDDFCALPDVPGVDAKVEDLGRVLAAARDQDAVRTSPLFETLVLPGFDTDAIDRVLEQDLPSLDEVAVNQVQAHVSRLGGGGEQWLVDGMRRLSRQELKGICPFCAQGLTGSALITHYRAYFSAAYRDLRKAVAEALEGVENTHGGTRADRVRTSGSHGWRATSLLVAVLQSSRGSYRHSGGRPGVERGTRCNDCGT